MDCKKMIWTLSVLVLLTSCKKQNEETEWTYEISGVRHSFLVTFNHLSIDHSNKANILESKIGDFYSYPSSLRFNNSKIAWANSWQAYQFFKPYYYMQGNLANPIFFDINRAENWNLNPAYIDSTNSSPNTGIIVDTATYPFISQLYIDGWHINSTSSSSIGYQVLEFLLWGEDNSTTSGGDRTQFEFGSISTIKERRSSFLRGSAIKLSSEFTTYFTSKFESEILLASNKDFMHFVLTGLIQFLEEDFAANTLTKPLLSQDPNDELSRYSENTIVDIKNKIIAVQLVLKGNELFTSDDSYYLLDFIGDVDASLMTTIELSLNEMSLSIESIQGNFDNAISSPSERPKIESILENIENLVGSLEEFALRINVEL